MGNEASADDVDEVGTSATVDTANLGATVADEIKVLRAIPSAIDPALFSERLIGSLHFINVIHTRSKVQAHMMILHMAGTNDGKSEKRRELYKGRTFTNRHITGLKK